MVEDVEFFTVEFSEVIVLIDTLLVHELIEQFIFFIDFNDFVHLKLLIFDMVETDQLISGLRSR